MGQIDNTLVFKGVGSKDEFLMIKLTDVGGIFLGQELNKLEWRELVGLDTLLDEELLGLESLEGFDDNIGVVLAISCIHVVLYKLMWIKDLNCKVISTLIIFWEIMDIELGTFKQSEALLLTVVFNRE